MKGPASRLLFFIVVSGIAAGFAAAGQDRRPMVADTTSPRDTLRSFVDACNEFHRLTRANRSMDRRGSEARDTALRILDCLDTRDLPIFARDVQAGEVAVALKEILDRVELPPWEQIPDAADIEAAGGFEALSFWRIPDTRITIERVEEGEHKHKYLFSRGTVSRAVSYYRDRVHLPYRTEDPQTSPGLYKWYLSAPGHPLLGAIVERLPEWMQTGRTLGMANWKWPGVALCLLVALALMFTLYSLQLSVGTRLARRGALAHGLSLAFPIAAMLVPVVFQHVSQEYLTVRGTPLYLVRFGSTVAVILAAIVVLVAASSRVSAIIIASPTINERGLNAQLIRVSCQVIGILAAFAVVLAGGQHLGIPIATLLASAGIGGIALALAAQDTLKTLFATMAIMVDRPCRVGDRIIVDRFEGDVEDIGLRSTKLRLLDGRLLTLSNDKIVARDIQNVTRRSHIGETAEIRVPIGTPGDKVERAVALIQDLLTGREGMAPDRPPRVFLDELGPQAFVIRVFYWYESPDLWEFRAWNSRLNIDLVRALEAEGIAFS